MKKLMILMTILLAMTVSGYGGSFSTVFDFDGDPPALENSEVTATMDPGTFAPDVFHYDPAGKALNIVREKLVNEMNNAKARSGFVILHKTGGKITGLEISALLEYADYIQEDQSTGRPPQLAFDVVGWNEGIVDFPTVFQLGGSDDLSRGSKVTPNDATPIGFVLFDSSNPVVDPCDDGGIDAISVNFDPCFGGAGYDYVAIGVLTSLVDGGGPGQDVLEIDDLTFSYTAVGLLPNPEDGASLFPDDPINLSWELIEPNDPGDNIVIDVVFSTEANKANWDFDEPDVNAWRLVDKDDMTAPTSVDTSGALPIVGETTYYWEVQAYDTGWPFGDPNNPVASAFQSFTTLNGNLPPTLVDAGEDDYTFFAGATATYELMGTIEEDPCDQVNTQTINWSVTPETGVSFDDDSSLTPVVTFDGTAVLGDYVFTMDVSDGRAENDASDSVTITLYADGCAAAKAVEGYSQVNARQRGDTNFDCVVDLTDLGVMSENWLSDESLTEFIVDVQVPE